MQESTTTIDDWLGIAKRRKWGFFFPALVVFLIAAIVALALTPIYKSTSTILIEDQEIPPEFVMSTVTTFVEQRLQIINQQIMSFSRLLEIINRFNLYADKRDRWTTEEIVAEMREDITFEPISADVVDRRTGRPMTATIAFTVSYEGENPNTVYQVANVLASLYLEENIQVRERQAKETSTFLAEEMAHVKSRLAELDGQIASFKEKHINELPELLQVNLAGLDRMDRDVERLTDQLRSMKEREGFLQAQLAGVPQFSADKQRLDELKVQLVHLKSRYSDQYPEIVKTKTEIAELEKRLGMASKENTDAEDSFNSPARSSLEPDNPAYVTLASQLSSVQAEISLVEKQIQDAKKQRREYQRRVEATPRVEEEYRVLSHERDNTQAKLNDLMAKAMEADVAHGLEREQKGERFILIDPARVAEEPYKPNRLAIFLIGIVLAIGAGVGGASIREFTDHSVHKESTLALGTSLLVLGSIPTIETAKEKARRRRKRLLLLTGIAAAVIIGFIIFHFFIMDFDILWARLSRRMGW